MKTLFTLRSGASYLLLGISGFLSTSLFVAFISIWFFPVMGAQLYFAVHRGVNQTVLLYLIPASLSFLYVVLMLWRNERHLHTSLLTSLAVLHFANLAYFLFGHPTEPKGIFNLQVDAFLSFAFLALVAFLIISRGSAANRVVLLPQKRLAITVLVISLFMGSISITASSLTPGGFALLRNGIQVKDQNACALIGKFKLYLPQGSLLLSRVSEVKTEDPAFSGHGRFGFITSEYQLTDREWKPPIEFFAAEYPNDLASHEAFKKSITWIKSASPAVRKTTFEAPDRICYAYFSRDASEQGGFQCQILKNTTLLSLNFSRAPTQPIEEYLTFFLKNEGCTSEI